MHIRINHSSIFLGAVAALVTSGCVGNDDSSKSTTGGSSSTAGNSSTGGKGTTGGAAAGGGSSSTSMSSAVGGANTAGGASNAGGTTSSSVGGMSSAGGVSSTPGGTSATSTTVATGGAHASATGGAVAMTTGGTTGAGGATGAAGGSTATTVGGTSSAGGTHATGGSTAATTGGTTGTSGTTGGSTTVTTGGTTSAGGASGGADATGGSTAVTTGGATAVGGTTGTAGSATGGAAPQGGTGTGGVTSTGGGSTGAGGRDIICSSDVPTDTSVAGIVWSDDFETNPYDGIDGTWQVDNSLAQAGSLAIHPPLKGANGGTDEMAITCGGVSHSELSFFYCGVRPTATQQLMFYVDDVLYETYGNTYNDSWGVGWSKVDIVVPSGTHHYRWDATNDTATQSPYWIDSIQCGNTPVVANSSGNFGFEEGFVPPEIGGQFAIDNSLVQAGGFSAHPWSLQAAKTASMTFNCGCNANNGIVFYYAGVRPTAGQQLNFYVDDVLNHTYGNTYNDSWGVGWTEVNLPLKSGMHQYQWEVTTDVNGQPPYWIDTIKCQ